MKMTQISLPNGGNLDLVCQQLANYNPYKSCSYVKNKFARQSWLANLANWRNPAWHKGFPVFLYYTVNTTPSGGVRVPLPGAPFYTPEDGLLGWGQL